ncbi:MAG: type II toxin-antitoxin system HicB family antitoxin [Chloroflexi bacterium]|nr:type II toxin-antitoxin system HicB family antitoxin [Chloroflexota bacterium]
MKLSYPAIFDPWDDGAGYTVTMPDLPGLVTEGDDMADAIYMAMDAAAGWILSGLEDGETAPKASKISDIKADKGCIVSMVAVDIDSYAEQFGQTSVRKNVTIPTWQETYIKKQRLSLSALAQEKIDEIVQKEAAAK